MPNARCVSLGIQAGLLGGLAVAAMFFVLDLARLEPLATPAALGATVLGPFRSTLDIPELSRIISFAAFGGNLLALTLLHFLAFSILGVTAIKGCEGSRVPANAFTGALFGLVVCSLAFYGCVALCGDQVLADIPGPMAVVGGNLFGGAVMGGYLQLRGSGQEG